ncbi:zinc finger protein GAI-ASSOCIATED FACTOR 1 [Nicotiana tabacum]|uniref:Protein indeterminate-domain 2 n=1 Tax=Nicotiana tabacum TaxID=4097 RepID=A0A1S4A2V7_TOBAC|nr:zinc finger protein GAI-ASSOCIATED FACTOR 1-like [Nicotiana tomentosiformis]XP_016471017.1 PREDICTED: protein indeterminate-domain 2-like [Nicotiana tabacum]
MPADPDNSSAMNDSTGSGEVSVSSSGNQVPPQKESAKKKRNLPGMPDPDAEVIALSPKTLLATNRFVCEICSKGFQRDQNLQLHRRGHNLPWKLRQRSGQEVKKRVYVCPETTCVHHDPSRALGDLTGIKKHFCRKHGEKKWKCDKCSKKYAVQSDLKAHSKICGTREYKCDCGTLFSRRDSFITHRAFCDVLAQESAKAVPEKPPNVTNEEPKTQVAASSSPPPTPSAPPPAAESQPRPSPPPSLPPPAAPKTLPPAAIPPSTTVISFVSSVQNPELRENSNPNSAGAANKQFMEETAALVSLTGSCSSSSSSCSNGSTSSNVFGSLFASSTASGSLPSQAPGFTDLFRAVAPDRVPEMAPPSSTEPISLCLAMNHGSSIFRPAGQDRRQYAPVPQPAMSATALLQKAAQMGAAATSSSLLRGLGVMSSSLPSNGQQEWSGRPIETNGASLAAGLGLGLPCDAGSGLKELMLGTPSVFGPKHPTLDLLGLGMAASGGPSPGLSALLTSMGSNLDMATAAGSFGSGDFSGKDLGRNS